MNKKTSKLIIYLSSLAMIGIISTQVFWIRNEYKLKDDQFSQSVLIALKSVTNQLLESRNDSIIQRYMDDPEFCMPEQASFLELFNHKTLDSLVQAEFGCMKIREDYVYGVYKVATGKFVMGQHKSFHKQLRDSRQYVSLKSLYKEEEYRLAAYIPHQTGLILGSMIMWLFVSALFLFVLVFAFTYTITSMFRQKKLSEMKSDFVNNMTHEFKTPISTISLAGEMLLKPGVDQDPERIKRYAAIIIDENIRLKNQVEQVLNIAILDKGEYKLNYEEININNLIEDIAGNFKLLINSRGGRLDLILDNMLPLVYADKLHLTNIITNLLDNANKYTENAPFIKIFSSEINNGIEISVEDNGIGIHIENQKHIFKKLYRVPTGNVHDVKGFGLGLYYVKTMTEAHGGHIRLKSEVGKGSRFAIWLPRHPAGELANRERSL